MTKRDPARLTEAQIAADLAVSEAEVAAGLTVPGEDVLAELDAAIARLEARRDSHAPARAAALRR